MNDLSEGEFCVTRIVSIVTRQTSHFRRLRKPGVATCPTTWRPDLGTRGSGKIQPEYKRSQKILMECLAPLLQERFVWNKDCDGYWISSKKFVATVQTGVSNLFDLCTLSKGTLQLFEMAMLITVQEII